MQPEIKSYQWNKQDSVKIVALTNHIETGFQNSMKMSAVFNYLTAAYDTVWSTTQTI